MAGSRKRPNKRRVGPTAGGASHQGRVTGATPAETARYTPKRPRFRIRPTYHKVIGWMLVAAGVLVAVLNDYAWFGPELLPGGHSEFYLVLGVVIAGWGSWWLGLFDAPS